MLGSHRVMPPSRMISESEELRPYVIVGDIGKNSFSTWYRGCHEGTRALVAIKMIRHDSVSAKEFDHIQGEIRILQSLSHQHISRLIDVIRGRGQLYMILEYYNGGDLEKYIEKRGAIEGLQYRLTPDTELQWWPHPPTGGLDMVVVRNFLSQLAAALKYLRERDVSHRNINPTTLLLMVPSPEELQGGHPSGVPILKLSGFIFARSLPTGTMAATLCGTPLYMAPEILRYERYDAKVDLWSVGAVLYEMAVGHPPFKAQNHIELLKVIETTDEIRFPDEIGSFFDENSRLPFGLWGPGAEPSGDPPIPNDIKELVRHLLRRKPTERSSFDQFFGSKALANSGTLPVRENSGIVQPVPVGFTREQVRMARGPLSTYGPPAPTPTEIEEEEEEKLRHEYVLIDDPRAIEFNQAIDESLAHPRQLHYPAAPSPPAPPSISRRTATNALNRAIGLASKKLLGSSWDEGMGRSRGSLPKVDVSNDSSNTGESGSDVPLPTTGMFDDDEERATEMRVSELMARLDSVFSDVAQYRELLRCTGEAAQRVLDSFQALLDMPQMNAIIGRKKLIVATQRLSQNSGLYPKCYELDGVQRQSDFRVKAGGSADIYRGTIDGQVVCLKVMRMFQTDDIHHFLKLVSKEAILWGQLKHRNVLPIYGLYRFENGLCFVAPWMEAGDINEYLKRHPSAPRRHLALDVAQGLFYLHENGIIHGDLKGANILVNAAGIACLADFGLSSISDPLILFWKSQSSAASKGGTARWQAPELFDVENDILAKNSVASDVYAWSCVCYEIFTGLVPFSHITLDAAVALQIMQGQRPSCPAKSSSSWTAWGLTESIWSLMTRCWAIDPAERPSIQNVIDNLSLDLDEDARPSEEGTDDVLSPARFRQRLSHVGDVASIVATLGQVLNNVLGPQSCIP